MVYKFVILPDAEKQLRKLDIIIAKRILKKIQWLAEQESPLRFAMPLHNSKIGDVRFRLGAYRIILIINQKTKTIGIAAIGHRKDIYQ